LIAGVNARALPADLAGAPFVLDQAIPSQAGGVRALDVPVRAPSGGTITAVDESGRANYRFVFRTRALIAGSFTQPPGEAETMYRPGIHGASAGQRFVISR
jgi:hypothetical protein